MSTKKTVLTPGNILYEDEYVQTPSEAYAERRELVENASTREEAEDAIQPILKAMVLHERSHDIDTDFWTRELAHKSVLTPGDISVMYFDLKDEWWTLVEDVKEYKRAVRV